MGGSVARPYLRYQTVLGVAWTLADLAGRDRPDHAMVERAIQFKEQRAA
ncbi:hypothetical protein ACTXG6_40325 [Pseudonocardia sp. Cha107L01]